jgi:hypothetical protein
MFIVIEHINNSWGRGYRIQAGIHESRCYYMTSKRDAVRLYRERYNLKYKKLVKVEY